MVTKTLKTEKETSYLWNLVPYEFPKECDFEGGVHYLFSDYYLQR